jgi:hypothetical protein
VEILLTNPLFLVFSWLTLTSVVGSVGYYWSKARRDDQEAALKQEMLQRGMSADDIVKVIQASKGKGPKTAPGEYLPQRAGEGAGFA